MMNKCSLCTKHIAGVLDFSISLEIGCNLNLDVHNSGNRLPSNYIKGRKRLR